MNTGGARQLCYIPSGWYRFGCSILLPIMNSTEKAKSFPQVTKRWKAIKLIIYDSNFYKPG